MPSERLTRQELQRWITPEISQEIRSRVVVTRLPELMIQVGMADPRSLNSLYRSVIPDGQRNRISTVPIKSKILVVSAPPEVSIHSIANAPKMSEESDAKYPVVYKTDKHWFLVQYLFGQATRHMHPEASEAFTVLDGEYFIHDESEGETDLIVANGWPKFAQIKKFTTDHQCFSYTSPAISIVVLTGESLKHVYFESSSREYLMEIARRSRNGSSEV